MAIEIRDGDIVARDVEGNVKVHIGMYEPGKFGLRVTNGEIYAGQTIRIGNEANPEKEKEGIVAGTVVGVLDVGISVK